MRILRKVPGVVDTVLPCSGRRARLSGVRKRTLTKEIGPCMCAVMLSPQQTLGSIKKSICQTTAERPNATRSTQ